MSFVILDPKDAPPIPAGRTTRSELAEALLTLPPGGFLFVPASGDFKRIAARAHSLTQTHPERRFSVRRFEHEGVSGIGIWRTEGVDPEEVEDDRVIAEAKGAMDELKAVVAQTSRGPRRRSKSQVASIAKFQGRKGGSTPVDFVSLEELA